jgi:hypothetical protein
MSPVCDPDFDEDAPIERPQMRRRRSLRSDEMTMRDWAKLWRRMSESATDPAESDLYLERAERCEKGSAR